MLRETLDVIPDEIHQLIRHILECQIDKSHGSKALAYLNLRMAGTEPPDLFIFSVACLERLLKIARSRTLNTSKW